MQQRSETQFPTNRLTSPSVEKFKKVVVIGLGQVGLPVAKYIYDRGFQTYGLDLDSNTMELAKKYGIMKAQDFFDIDVFIICISTHKQNDIYSPDVTAISEIGKKISNEAKNGALVSIESTIPRGTSRKIFDMMKHRVHVVHVPHRWYNREEDIHGVNQLRVIGGVSKCCLMLGLEFYGTKNDPLYARSECYDQDLLSPFNPSIKSLSIPLHPVSEIEIAELTKIAENSFRYVQIAFAEELYMYCHKTNLNFDELRDTINTKWNINLPEAQNGISGHCLPKDAKMFVGDDKVRNKIITSAMQVDDEYRRHRLE